MTTTRVALVTGAAAGIGAACSRRLAQEGIAVGVLDLDEGRCADTIRAIKADGGKALALGADVSDRDQVKAAVAKGRPGAVRSGRRNRAVAVHQQPAQHLA